MQQWFSTLTPVSENENPAWFYRFGRALLLALLLALPFVYDPSVPEVAGDMRWYLTRWSGLLLLLLGVIALAIKLPKFQIKLPIAAWLVAGLMFMASLSLVDTYSVPRSWWFLKHFLGFGMLFGLVYFFRHPGWYRNLLWAAVLPILVLAPLTTAQFLVLKDADIAQWLFFWPTPGLIDFYQQSAPPGATFANKNLVGSWLATLLPLTVYLFTSSPRRWTKGVSIALFTLGSCALLYTRSRASWLALFVSLILFAAWWVVNPATRATLKTCWRTATPWVLGAALIFVGWAAQLESRTGSTALNTGVLSKAASLADVNSGSVGSRLAYLLNGLVMMRDHPINGVGINAFHTAYPKYHEAMRPTPDHGYSMRARPQRTHNDLLQAYIELGILGGVLMTACFIAVLGMAIRTQGFGKATKADRLPIFLGLSLTTLCINATGDFPLQMPMGAILLFLLFGMLTGLYRSEFKSDVLYGPERTFSLPRWGWLCVIGLVGAAALFTVQDDLFRRASAQHLKLAMSRVMAGVIDTQTKYQIDRAHTLYPLNSRLQEYRSVIYSNFPDNKVTWAKRGEVVEEYLSHDPYATNGLINIGAIKFNLAIRAQQLGNNQRVADYGNELLSVHDQLQVVGKNVPHVPATAGLGYYLLGDYASAHSYFRESLLLDNSHPPAVWGYTQTDKILKADAAQNAGEVQNSQ